MRSGSARWRRRRISRRIRILSQVAEPIYSLVDVYDVTFRGYLGQPIKGWFLEPAGNTSPLPCLVGFIGYGGGRNLPVEHMAVPAAGFAYLVMDTRGQGSSGSPGDTPDERASRARNTAAS